MGKIIVIHRPILLKKLKKEVKIDKVNNNKGKLGKMNIGTP